MIIYYIIILIILIVINISKIIIILCNLTLNISSNYYIKDFNIIIHI